ncbi:SDR family oxidoreductase [Raineyella fluvialis]|uniref:SDR family oxidoreductase n=1 Tax=Raineyella fluvialis TaxID=2662261 RepID=A0A5Q2F9Q2_9ACTN|nr:SDR family oxidoreductase [Raineyella fluvialis]QGF23111.1 SDR family oxidoreductase [Raineyella fluvialis]
MRTIVVTGAASGIGRTLAGILADRGDRVIGVDLHDADVTADLTTPEGRTALVERVREVSGGSIDAIVANAGLALAIPKTVSVNFFGAIATLEGLRPLLAGSAAPRASVTCSMASLYPPDQELLDDLLADDETAALARAEVLAADPKLSALIYGTTKQALAKWVRRRAATADWAGAGIPLNGIAPGIVLTPMTKDLTSTQEAVDALLQQVPMPLNGMMGPEVPARLHAWLVSEENSHLCGQIVFVDGGSDVVIRGDSTW